MGRWIVVTLIACGCVSARPIVNDTDAPQFDWIEVQFRSGEVVELANASIVDDSLIGYEMGEQRRRIAIPMTGISSLSQKRFDPVRTLIWSGAIGAAFFAYVAYVNAKL